MTILKLYNTLTRIKQEVVSKKDNEISLYTCGPTVYDYAHIGNFRTYVFEDLLKRTLIFFGYKVTHVMNITDVDDKTINGALKNKLSLKDYTKPYIDAFFEDLKKLNIYKADSYPEATSYIKPMIEIIEKLIEKKVAYRGNDNSIYFSINNFPSYGKLSHLKLDDLQKGASNRVVLDEYDKDNASDFVLWKAYDEERDGGIYWDSPFGKGRPGWHIECSAMALKCLGETVDIHCGGVDNIFPHHENEIAQSESFTGKEFVSIWAHCEHLIVNNKKMSKSLGNFFTLRNLLDKGYSGSQIRYLLLQVHYRTQLNFTFEGLDAAKKSLKRINDFISRLQTLEETDEKIDVSIHILNKANLDFKSALADDLNISAALAVFFDLIREVNTLIDDNTISKNGADKILDFIKSINSVLALFDLEGNSLSIPREVNKLLDERQEARKNKDFSLSDQLRDKILSEGYIIEDSPKGPTLKKK